LNALLFVPLWNYGKATIQRSEPEDLPVMHHNSSNLSEEKKEEMLTFTGLPLLL
jgi:hypothetical protein